MGLNWGRGAVLSTLAAAIVATSASAMAQDASVKVKLKLKDADMMTATRTLTSQTGVQFVVEPSLVPFGKISLEVSDVTPEDAIRYICQAAGAEYRRDEHGVFIIGHRRPAPLPDPAPAVVGKKATVVKKLRILKADAGDIADMLLYQKTFSDTKHFEQLKRFNAVTQPGSTMFSPTGVVANNGYSQNFQPIGASPIRNSMLANGESSGQINLPGSVGESSGQQFGGGIGQGGGIGGGGIGQGGRGGQGGQGGQGNANLVGGQGLVPEGIDFISYDPTDNSLIVEGTEDAIADLQDRIGLFDKAPRQVLIKVEFITTTETIDRTFGTEFLYQRGTVFAGTRPGSFIRTQDPVFLNYASGNVTGRLRASLVEGRGKVVSAPIIRTLNNQPAQISASVTTTIFITQVQATQGVILSNSNPVDLVATTNLSVAPRINDDNTITLYLNPTISAFVGNSIGPQGQQIPNRTVQSLAVVARVRNGETMVLGGLTTKNEDNSTNRVPVLSELPIIGQFFRTNGKQKSTSELLIFVTPTIVDEDTTAAPVRVRPRPEATVSRGWSGVKRPTTFRLLQRTRWSEPGSWSA